MGSYYDWDELFELDRERQKEEDRQFFFGCFKYLLIIVALVVAVISTILWICLG